jgi:hypothetical protein
MSHDFVRSIRLLVIAISGGFSGLSGEIIVDPLIVLPVAVVTVASDEDI